MYFTEKPLRKQFSQKVQKRILLRKPLCNFPRCKHPKILPFESVHSSQFLNFETVILNLSHNVCAENIFLTIKIY